MRPACLTRVRTRVLSGAYGKLGLVGMSNIQSVTFNPPSADDPVLGEVVRRLCEVYRPLRIYLFGSAARGDAGPDSDYDFLIVVSDDAPSVLKECRLGYQALSGLGIAKDILVWTRHEFDTRLHLKASLPSTVVEEGRLLYAA